jgi:hypothetical protein
VISPLRTAQVLALVSAVACFSATSVPPARAEEDLHHVTYAVTSESPNDVDIYYRDVDPPDWAAYSHNPYEYCPKARVRVGPGQAWTLDVLLVDPTSWAMVVASSGLSPVTPHLRCVLSVDGVVVATHDGPRGALCSLRSW